MFVAWRDLMFAKGRFALLVVVVGLITLLVGFLSGLTAGLGSQSISAVTAIGADRYVLSTPTDEGKLAFSDSSISRKQAQTWQEQVPGADVAPVGISQTGIRSGESQSSVAVFGMIPEPGGTAPSEIGQVTLSRTVADELGGLVRGDKVELQGESYSVTDVVPDQMYSHLPVIWTSLTDWQDQQEAQGTRGAYATVLAAFGAGDFEVADQVAGVTSAGPITAMLAIGSFSSEIGSLLMIVSLLFVISAVVIGAFFTVWMIQRSPDIAVLKALGAKHSTLLRDSLGQAMLVLLAGVGGGMLVTVAFGLLITGAGGAVPFVLSPWTTALPAGVLIATGLIGASFALRNVVRAEPLSALGANR